MCRLFLHDCSMLAGFGTLCQAGPLRSSALSVSSNTNASITQQRSVEE